MSSDPCTLLRSVDNDGTITMKEYVTWKLKECMHDDDEMFEIMTLKQTGKMQKNLPIVLLGKAHWLKVIDWKAFAESGTIAQKDVDELLFTDDVDEAFEFITERLIMN